MAGIRIQAGSGFRPLLIEPVVLRAAVFGEVVQLQQQGLTGVGQLGHHARHGAVFAE